jgi:two-component system chemotaxis response regulator CheB
MNEENKPESKIRVLVVDDSAIMRRIITTALKTDPGIEVVGIAEDGLVSLNKVRELQPDVITMDVEMPNMDGLTAVAEIRKFNRTVPIIMFSTLTQKGAEATINALTSGASDYVGKPTDVSDTQTAFNILKETLLPKVRALHKKPFRHVPKTTGQMAEQAKAPSKGPLTILKEPIFLGPPAAVVLGVSTGGPLALIDIFSEFKKPLPVPMFIVQHMPAKFTELMAQRLSTLSPIEVVEAKHGDIAESGKVYIAPGGFHLHLERMGAKVVMYTSEDPPENNCRPAVDVLFRTAAQIYKSRLLGIVLTGMGSDGLKGAQDIVSAGGTMWVQDEETSVIWGMPGVIANAHLAHKIMPLKKVAGEMLQRLQVKP